MYKDMKGLTPEQEYHQSVLFQGLVVKHEQKNEKRNIIAPELSIHHMSEHAQNELKQIVSTFPELES